MVWSGLTWRGVDHFPITVCLKVCNNFSCCGMSTRQVSSCYHLCNTSYKQPFHHQPLPFLFLEETRQAACHIVSISIKKNPNRKPYHITVYMFYFVKQHIFVICLLLGLLIMWYIHHTSLCEFAATIETTSY